MIPFLVDQRHVHSWEKKQWILYSVIVACYNALNIGAGVMPTVLLHVVRGLTLIEAKFSAPGGSHYVNPYNLGIELNFLMTFGKSGNGLRWLLPLPKDEFTLPEY